MPVTPDDIQMKALPLGDGRRATTLMAGLTNQQGPWVVCLHGFPDNHHSFRRQIPALIRAGYRVACPMLPGYEPSSIHPKGHYDVGTVADQLLHLTETLQSPLHNSGQTSKPGIHLVGHDWGAIVGYLMVGKRPSLLKSFTSLSIPYGMDLKRILTSAWQYLPHSWYIQFFQLRGVAEFIVSAGGMKFVDFLIDHWNPGWQMPASHTSSIRQTLSEPGVLSSALGYYRAIYGFSHRERQARASFGQPIHTPTLMIQGVQDRCIPPALWEINRMDKFSVPPQHIRLSSGHWPHQELAENINLHLIDHLNRHAA